VIAGSAAMAAMAASKAWHLRVAVYSCSAVVTNRLRLVCSSAGATAVASVTMWRGSAKLRRTIRVAAGATPRGGFVLVAVLRVVTLM